MHLIPYRNLTIVYCKTRPYYYPLLIRCLLLCLHDNPRGMIMSPLQWLVNKPPLKCSFRLEIWIWFSVTVLCPRKSTRTARRFWGSQNAFLKSGKPLQRLHRKVYAMFSGSARCCDWLTALENGGSNKWHILKMRVSYFPCIKDIQERKRKEEIDLCAKTCIKCMYQQQQKQSVK